MASDRRNTFVSSSDDNGKDKPVASSPVSSPQTVRVHLGEEYEQNPGVARVEALHRHLNRTWKWILYISIGALSYVYSLDTDTTGNYLPIATSAFGKHSFIGTIGTADGIITAVGKPCVAKIADLWSRPVACSVVLVFYMIGYILVASARTVYAVAGGMIMYTVGHTGLFLITDIIVSDISPLEWRGFAAGLTSAPVILNSFISAEIVSSVEAGPGWRWGYGMFAIIIPAVMAPAIATLFAAERRAKKNGELVSGRSSEESKSSRSALQLLKEFTVQMDIVGLILVGLIFGLILFPISLAKTVHGGWSNASIIAMLVVGVACIPVFIIWERFFATQAIMSKRLIMNRAFLAAVGIHFFHQFADPFWNLYLSSFVWVVKDWDTRSWVYFNNSVNVTTSVFNLIGGLILKYTHRYKYLQACGLGIRLIGIGLLISPHAGGAVVSTVPLASDIVVWSQILIGIGGAFSVVGSRVGAQASVRHEDLASLTALLSVWTSLGGSVGSAVASAMWTANMPSNLDKYLPGVPQATINKLYGSIKSARNASPAVRQGVIEAYAVTTRPMFIVSLGLSCVCFILAFFMPNYYLGKTQNAVDGKDLAGEVMTNATGGETGRGEKGRKDEST